MSWQWRFFFLAIISGSVMLLFSGCQENINEKRGYSPIPQNRPAEWETNPMKGIPN